MVLSRPRRSIPERNYKDTTDSNSSDTEYVPSLSDELEERRVADLDVENEVRDRPKYTPYALL